VRSAAHDYVQNQPARTRTMPATPRNSLSRTPGISIWTHSRSRGPASPFTRKRCMENHALSTRQGQRAHRNTNGRGAKTGRLPVPDRLTGMAPGPVCHCAGHEQHPARERSTAGPRPAAPACIGSGSAMVAWTAAWQILDPRGHLGQRQQMVICWSSPTRGGRRD
jgi:hypothetical protein